MEIAGPLCFGIVIGWITYRALRRRSGHPGLSDIATVIGAVGGGAVTGLFPHPGLFYSYSVGLALGFFGYLLVSLGLERKAAVTVWMDDVVAGPPAGRGRQPYQ